MDGQPYTSTVINGEQSFSFPGSYAPFTWIRSVPTFQRKSTQVESMTVRIETGNCGSAGTDDDVYLNIGSHASRSTSVSTTTSSAATTTRTSVPIGTATRDGLGRGRVGHHGLQQRLL